MSDGPATRSLRVDDAWVVERRGPKAVLDPRRAYAALWEEEPDAAGALVPTAVVFLTNRECPFRCVMCDLWVNTLDETVPGGAIPAQIRAALAQLGPVPASATAVRQRRTASQHCPVGSHGEPTLVAGRRQIKLYNAGSYFDPRAIPPSDDDDIARQVGRFERVIVEAHPAFLAGEHGERCLRFRDRLSGRLEVAIGLETAHPEALARLNKRMTVDTFARAARFLADHDIALRVFVLVNPPFLHGADGVEWACRSLDVAAACGATAASLIPTRGGNGALEALGSEYEPPTLPAVETVLEYGLSVRGMRVFADLWDIERFADCSCSPARVDRLRAMNRAQRAVAGIACEACASRGVIVMRP